MKKDMMFQELNKQVKTNKGRITMRRSIYLFALLTLFVVGCSEESSVLAPTNNVSTTEPNWIALPKAEGFGVEASFSASKNISGGEGGSIYVNKSYTTSTGKTVTIYAKASFPEGAFSGTKYITMTVDDETCTVTFSPSMVFNKSVSYNVTYTGIDLSNINPSSVKFAYLATDGSVQYATHSGITVTPSTGTLKVSNAKIPHFSRYGFVN